MHSRRIHNDCPDILHGTYKYEGMKIVHPIRQEKERETCFQSPSICLFYVFCRDRIDTFVFN